MDRKELITMLFELMPVMNRQFHKHIGQSNIPHQQIRLLHMIKRHYGQPLGFYTSKMHLSKPNMTKLVEDLRQKGYVERIPDEKDRRVHRIILTKAGNSFIQEHFNKIVDNAVVSLEGFNDQSLKEVQEALETLTEFLKQLDKETKGEPSCGHC